MSEGSNFVKYDINLKEWINKLYADIDSMHSFLEKHSFNVTRADLDLSCHFGENSLEEQNYDTLDLEPIFNGHDKCTDFAIIKSSPGLTEREFFAEKEIIGKPISSFIADNDDKLLTFLKNSYQYRKPMISEYFHQRNNKSYRIITQPGKILVVLLQDITMEQIHQLGVKRYENLFSKAQEISTSGFFQYNTYNQELYVTEGALNIFECPRSMNVTERIKLKDYISCVHDDDKEHVLSEISDEKLTSNLDYEHRINLRDKVKYVHVLGAAFYDPIEDSISLIGTVEDITHLKEVKHELKRVKGILNEIERISGIAYWEYDFLTDQFTGTPEAVEILGITESDLPISFGEFLNQVHKKDQEEFYEGFHQSLAEQRDWEGDYRIVDRFGVEKKVHIICRNRFSSKHKPLSSKGFICNQTELKNYKHDSRTLKQVKKELKELKELFNDKLNEQLTEIRSQDKYLIQKSKYAAINDLLSHISIQWLEVLNALSTQIHNWVEAYECEELTPEGFHQIHQTVENQIKYLRDKVHFFNQYHKAESLAKKANIHDLISELQTVVLKDEESSNVKLKNEVEKDLEITINTNEFKQALQEIIKNSYDEFLLRKIEKPQIKIKSKIMDNNLIISILDNAGGISLAIMDRIYEPYFSSPDKSEAPGLGLYISKMIIEKVLKGSIKARNHNSGALFEISLPLAE
ncbi:MAG: PAS domain-containing sensor histidine kinase [Candidatus Stygibacter australis]|nr:PAS domain-containing sensor histidine kinase [Candidatus Stygibacter australis]